MSVLLALPENRPLAASLISGQSLTSGEFEIRNFPDGETYIRIKTPVQSRNVIILCSLNAPNDRVLPLILLAETARDLGARSVGLVCPYLAYMRQDKRFKRGEGVTSRYFAHLLSDRFDWLVTIDPHLHRYANLRQLYTIPATALHTIDPVSDWITSHVEHPVIVGPDLESEQWAAAVARKAHAPYVVLEKERYGDSDVEVHIPDVDQWKDHRPIIVDDIISTAETMIDTVRHLRAAGLNQPVCIGVHALFSTNSYADLIEAGADRIITCNTVSHPSNEIDVAPLILGFLNELPSG